jgi:glutaredoxin
VRAGAGLLLFLDLFQVPSASAEAPLIVIEEDRRVSVRVQNASLQEVLQAFSDATGVEITTSGPVDETVSVDFARLPAYRALRTILRGRSSIGFYASNESGAEDASPRLTQVWILNRATRSGPNLPGRRTRARSQRPEPAESLRPRTRIARGADPGKRSVEAAVPNVMASPMLSISEAPAVASRGATPVLAAHPRLPPPTSVQPNIVIYTSRGCGSCRRALAYLDGKGISYVHKDITNDPEARREFRAKGGGGVPLIEVNGEAMRGFNASRFDQLLARES